MTEEEEPDSPDEAMALMVGRLHPKRDVQEYLTMLRNREVSPAALMHATGEMLRECNSPTNYVLQLLGLNPDNKYPIKVYKGYDEKTFVQYDLKGNPVLVKRREQIWVVEQVDAVIYAKDLIRRNRGIAQSLSIILTAQKLNNYRVAREGAGRLGGIKIASSIMTGKAEQGIGIFQRFRRAMGQQK